MILSLPKNNNYLIRFNKDLPDIIKNLYTKVSGGLEDDDPKSSILSPKFKEKMMKSKEKLIVPPKVQRLQSITEKLKEESQSLTTNKVTGKKSTFDLLKDREVVIVKKESKHKSKKKSAKETKKVKIKTPKKFILPFNEGINE